MSSRPRRPAGRFIAPNGRTRSRPLREVPSLGTDDEDLLREVEIVASHTDPRDEPEQIGPAILTSYAEVNRRIMSQRIVIEVAEAQERRPEMAPAHRLETVRQRAKAAHVDMSHPIHLVQIELDKARFRGQDVKPRALERLEGLEALLDGVSIQRLAA